MSEEWAKYERLSKMDKALIMMGHLAVDSVPESFLTNCDNLWRAFEYGREWQRECDLKKWREGVGLKDAVIVDLDQAALEKAKADKLYEALLDLVEVIKADALMADSVSYMQQAGGALEYYHGDQI